MRRKCISLSRRVLFAEMKWDLLVAGCLFIMMTTAPVARSLEKCCPGLPCYDDGPPCGSLPLPQCPETMHVEMNIFTQRNPSNGQPITRDSIPSEFRGSQMTVFIVHGYTERGRIAPWVRTMKSKLLDKGDYNVIIVDWAGGSINLNYFQSASDTRTVGGEVALVANNTINNGGSVQSRLYCIGFSLGAHICGHAGKLRKFGRITGLDPAGPAFETHDWSCGLNPSCADLVDNIHTNGEPYLVIPNMGTMKPLGHIDFYPNGGGNQPQCFLLGLGNLELGDLLSGNITIIDMFRGHIGCSHYRSTQYYTESIDTPYLSRYQCSDPQNLPGSCQMISDPVHSLGFSANTYAARGIFYLTVDS